MKLINKTFSLREEMIQKLDDIQEDMAFNTQSAALQYCIAEAHSKMLRNEKRAKKITDGDGKVSIDEARRKRQEDACRLIAKKLGATLTRSGDGFLAEYYTHSKMGSFRQRLPLMSLTEELVDKQYTPSKEAVEEHWKKTGKPALDAQPTPEDLMS